ncbi:MAG: argininosuccinate lyase, partial [Rhodospirillaceae bacterium]|nr:argininosuccinate lyase [Rhodospirillaceae bacterium]
LTVMKGLPLAYSKDMQEDKEPLFDAADNLALAVAAMTGMVKDMKPDPARMRAAASVGFATATDLADWLVQNLDMPFRQAHHVVGSLVKAAETKGCDLDGLTLEEMQQAEPRLTRAVFRVLTLDYSVASRRSYGGTSPANVRRAIAQARERFL